MAVCERGSLGCSGICVHVAVVQEEVDWIRYQSMSLHGMEEWEEEWRPQSHSVHVLCSAVKYCVTEGMEGK